MQPAPTNAEHYHFGDFTEDAYRSLLATAKQKLVFAKSFVTPPEAPHVLWRHDVDMSVHRALRLASIEHEMGVQATYFILLHSEFYNFLEEAILTRVRRIVELGHAIGLHFDANLSPGLTMAALEEKAEFERRIITHYTGASVDVLSFHNPNFDAGYDLRAPMVGGMRNVYCKEISEKYYYVSDSNGYWRFERLREVLDHPPSNYLHVLTHPEWWTEEARSPRQRVQRCIDGRARWQGEEYDAHLQRHGRLNVY